MRTLTFIAIAISISIAQFVSAQDTITNTSERNLKAIQILEDARQNVEQEEKDALRKEVETINKRLDDGEITIEESTKLKQAAAEKRALNIENRLAILDNKIALLKRNDKYDESNKNSQIIVKGDAEIFGIRFSEKDEDDYVYDRRTTSDLVLGVGLNNVISDDGSLNDSNYKLGGSRFFELGIAWKTRVFKNSNFLRVKYGFSFVFDGLKPTDNRLFVDNGDETTLETFALDLDKSKFRQDHLIFPVHFEIGSSRKIEKENYFRYDTHNQFKLGLGGFAGFNLRTIQKIKYEENGDDLKIKNTNNFNTNNVVYGLSGYVAFGDVALYAKYNLNTIFKNNPVEQRNISLGVRFDMD